MKESGTRAKRAFLAPSREETIQENGLVQLRLVAKLKLGISSTTRACMNSVDGGVKDETG